MKIKKLIPLFAAVFVLSGSLSFITAQADKTQAKGDQKLRDNINMLMLLRMTQVLDLTEEQAAKLFPKMNRFEKEKRKINQETGKQMRRLRLAVKEEELDKQEISSRLNRIKTLRSQLKTMEAEMETFIAQHLSVEQQARYLIFFQDFYQEMREKLNQVSNKRKKSPVKR